MSNIYGVSAYQQTSGTRNNSKTNSTSATKTDETNSSQTKSTDKVKTTPFKTISSGSSLIPTVKEGYGNVIGDVELSDKAKDYYDKLKAKFHNMDFILVSKDMKSQVAANAAAYGNSAKQVVLIDDEKIEKMATDESFRKKYEGIIAMSQLKLQEAKNSLSSSGAGVKNFGMSVDSNGKATFFATVEKAAKKKAEKKAADKKSAEKKAAKAKEKDLAKKKAEEKKVAEKAADKKAEEAEKEISNEPIYNKEYVEIKADSMEDLVNKVSTYAYDNSERNVMTDGEKLVGQNFDFKG